MRLRCGLTPGCSRRGRHRVSRSASRIDRAGSSSRRTQTAPQLSAGVSQTNMMQTRSTLPARFRLFRGISVEGSVGQRAWAGARLWGGVFAPYALILALMLVVVGPEYQSSRRAATMVRLDLLLVLYPLGAVIAGAVIGTLAPLTGHRAGAIFTGMLALAPWSVGLALCMNRGYVNWTAGHTIIVSVMAIALGSGVGFALADAPMVPGVRRRWVQRKQRVTSRNHPGAG